jgi:hypothetical protein
VKDRHCVDLLGRKGILANLQNSQSRGLYPVAVGIPRGQGVLDFQLGAPTVRAEENFS